MSAKFKKKPIVYARVMGSGKIKLTITKMVKPVFKKLLETAINEWFTGSNEQMNLMFCIDHMFVALWRDTYNRSLQIIHLQHCDSTILITRAEAIALWRLSQHYDEVSMINPESGNLFLQLHKILS